MSKEETKLIPGASKYSINASGEVLNTQSNTPVFHKEGKVRLYVDGGKDRRIFDVKKLIAELFGEVKKAEKKVSEKPVKKAEKKRGSNISEIQELFLKGKTRDQINALGKYNPNTVRAQYYFMIADKKIKKDEKK